ncbi:DUF2232 domain-containing protein [Marinisporobacter balticus]|nr:DUF2232 domain-containing protein [Marinisporobacter balticus]
MQEKKRAIVEAVLVVVLMSIFTIVGVYIPVLTLFILFIPTSFIILGKRYGTGFAILSVVAWGVITGGVLGIYSMFFVGVFGMTAIVIVYMMNKGYSAQKVLGAGTLTSLISILLAIGSASKTFGVDVIEQMSETFAQSMNMQIKMYETIGIEPYKLELLKKTIVSGVELVIMSIPAEIIIVSTFFAYMNYRFAMGILKKIDKKIEPLPPLRRLRLPKNIIMGTILIMILTTVTQYFGFANYQSLVLNIFLIVQLVYFLQGFAVISHFLYVFRMNTLLRILIYTLFVFNGSGMFIMAVIGFIDAMINLRKLKTEN